MEGLLKRKMCSWDRDEENQQNFYDVKTIFKHNLALPYKKIKTATGNDFLIYPNQIYRPLSGLVYTAFYFEYTIQLRYWYKLFYEIWIVQNSSFTDIEVFCLSLSRDRSRSISPNKTLCQTSINKEK